MSLLGFTQHGYETSFANLQSTEKPNEALWSREPIAPKGIPIQQAPLKLPVSLDDALQLLSSILVSSPRTQLLFEDTSQHFLVVIERSRWFRFPDYLYVQCVPLDDTVTEIHFYSHSVYGYSDLGVNQKRIERIASQVKTAVKTL